LRWYPNSARTVLVPQFSKNIVEAVDTFIKLPPIIWYLIPVLLLGVSIHALRDGLTRRSRLLRPEALQLKADNPAHSKGRSEDIERLSTLCHECQQVHLVGESGAGKSALIQAGLKSRYEIIPHLSGCLGTGLARRPMHRPHLCTLGGIVRGRPGDCRADNAPTA
jgi:hypothetical protein